jgi:hypothetical protein
VLSVGTSPPPRIWLERYLLLLGAAIIAVVSARWGAGSWHDASRLATVECLVDYHTLAIDRSIYVEQSPILPNPYAEDMVAAGGSTFDRVLINGRYYSHQPPVPAMLMAIEYQLWKWCTGITARERPDVFYFVMTLGSCGLAYVVAVGCMHGLAVCLGLGRILRLALPISLAVSTVALVYVRNVNSHLLLLGITSALSLLVLAGQRLLFGVGTLTGLAYAVDSAVGLPLLICTAVLVAHRGRRWGPVSLFSLGVLPWCLLHHAVNYGIGGTFKPYGAVPEYFAWSGSAFDVHTMTGIYNHAGLWQFADYSFSLLFGDRGFLIHNPPLLLAAVAAVALTLRRPAEYPEVVWAVSWSVATWLLYSLFSINYSGQCFSIRWFIPLLAPGFLVLAVFFKQYPRPLYTWGFVLVSVWGAYFAIDAWARGPWRIGYTRNFDVSSLDGTFDSKSWRMPAAKPTLLDG